MAIELGGMVEIHLSGYGGDTNGDSYRSGGERGAVERLEPAMLREPLVALQKWKEGRPVSIGTIDD